MGVQLRAVSLEKSAKLLSADVASVVRIKLGQEGRVPQLTIPCYTQLCPPMHSSLTADPQGPRGCSRLWWHCLAITQGLENTLLQREVSPGTIIHTTIPSPPKFQLRQLPLPSFPLHHHFSRLFFMPLSIWNIKQTRDAVCEIKMHWKQFYSSYFLTQLHHKNMPSLLKPFPCSMFLIVTFPDHLYRCLLYAKCFHCWRVILRQLGKKIFGQGAKQMHTMSN